MGTIAIYGSAELTLPDDSTHPPDSIYTGLRWYPQIFHLTKLRIRGMSTIRQH